MYVIKWKNEIVARQEGEVVKSLDNVKAPWALFGGNRTASVHDLMNWMEDRMFPENRLDKDKLLKEMGLKEYNYLDIIEQTKGVLTGVDHYSIHWVE